MVTTALTTKAIEIVAAKTIIAATGQAQGGEKKKEEKENLK